MVRLSPGGHARSRPGKAGRRSGLRSTLQGKDPAMTASMPSGAFIRPARFSPAEWDARVQLAACYRIFDRLGWTELIYNHISLRVPGEASHYLINPFGLHYSEVCASNLVKVDLEGGVVGHSDWPINPAGITF